MPLITLLTDFGLSDTYVGQMKGAILGIAPSVHLVDLTHAVPPQDVLAGAFLLWTAVEPFGRDAVHLAVVDPGVGSSRRALAMRCARGDIFVGPDNGLLMPAVERLGGVSCAVELSDSRYWRPALSSTFHGRDIFGPVAAHLANGIELEALGPRTEHFVPLELPQRDGLAGEIVHVDTYGNLVTNIPGDVLPPHYIVHIRGCAVRPAANYAAVAPGDLLALVGSAGLLEISARDTSAARVLEARRGARLIVEAAAG